MKPAEIHIHIHKHPSDTLLFDLSYLKNLSSEKEIRTRIERLATSLHGELRGFRFYVSKEKENRFLSCKFALAIDSDFMRHESILVAISNVFWGEVDPLKFNDLAIYFDYASVMGYRTLKSFASDDYALSSELFFGPEQKIEGIEYRLTKTSHQNRNLTIHRDVAIESKQNKSYLLLGSSNTLTFCLIVFTSLIIFFLTYVYIKKRIHTR